MAAASERGMNSSRSNGLLAYGGAKPNYRASPAADQWSRPYLRRISKGTLRRARSP